MACFHISYSSIGSRHSVPFAMAQQNTGKQNSNKSVMNVRIKGLVQGVSYRMWTAENAERLGLDGWVRNRGDGSVEALFAGRPDDVQAMIQKCYTGPPASRVSDVEAQPVSLDDVPKGFSINPSVYY